ncbi:methionyl-tRNA formyltransferase [Peptococcus simiae]|uniref:Methionyl-tRNA formyltransferase n=1 Tax=Peptococcus simiae TaxID=1643805 RepID=A0ABW9GWX4_9FIRM
MRVIFMGTPDFAVRIAEAVIAAGHDLVAVYTQPDKRAGRGKKVLPPPVKVFAEERGIPVYQPAKLDDEAFTDFIAHQADGAVVAAYGKILPKKWLEALPQGFVNVHASLLPAYRGAAPIQWAIRNGDAETGISLMRMEEGLDTGAVYTQDRTAIGPEEDSDALFERLAALGGAAIEAHLTAILSGQLAPVAQDDSQASYAPKFSKADEAIDWRQDGQGLVQLNLAFGHQTGTYTKLAGQRLKVIKMTFLSSEDSDQAPGTILNASKAGIDVQTGAGVVRLQTVQPAGKKAMPVHAYLNGTRLAAGDHFDAVEE